MSGVLVVGALHLDVVVDAPHLPALDETVMASGVAYRFGGKGGNQAVAASRMGASVAMAGQVGDDSFAMTVLDALDAAGVNRVQVRQVPGATGMSVAIVEPGGEYGAVVVSGVNRGLQADEIDPAGAGIVLLQNEIPPEVNLAVARKARGARIVLNAAPARQLSPALLALTDLLIVNRLEAAQMTGSDPDRLDGEAAVRELAALGPPTVLLTLGADGVLGLEGATLFRVSPPLRARGSAHGAGDAFVGALAAELVNGAALQKSVEFAAAAAAQYVATPPSDRSRLSRQTLRVAEGRAPDT